MKQNKNYKKLVIIITISLIIFMMYIKNINKNNMEIDNKQNIIEETSENELKENIIIEDNKTNILDNENKIEKTTEEIQGEIKELKEKNIIEETDKKERNFTSNVAFIGDSRTQAFLMYAGLSEVTDYTNVGLMVDTAITKKFVKGHEGEKITILDDMKNKEINTVYIMLGVNELGWAYSSIFINKYEELIDSIRMIKPNCEIVVQSIIPLTKSKSDNDNIYNNSKVKEYNELIKKMAKERNIAYIDLESVLADTNGNLPEEASSDGIHLNKEYCLKWLEYLKKN